LQKEKEKERARQEKLKQQRAKEVRAQSNLDFLREHIPSYLEQINEEFFSNNGIVSGWEETETDNHTFTHWYESSPGHGRDAAQYDSIIRWHRTQKNEIKLSTSEGAFSLFVPLREKRLSTSSPKGKFILSGWVDTPLKYLYINEDCTCYSEGADFKRTQRNKIPLDLKKDQLLIKLRRKILAEVIKLKTSE